MWVINGDLADAVSTAHKSEMPTKRPRGFPMQAHLSGRIGYHHQWRIVPPDG
jgi:hypothetical protein